MTSFKKYLGWLAGPLAVVMFLTTSGIGVAQAGIVGTDEVAHQEAVAADRAELIAQLDREDVRDQLAALGISPAEAADRINALSDAELASVMDQVNEMPAGEGAVGAIVGAALIVFIILLITDIVGATDVFDFVN